MHQNDTTDDAQETQRLQLLETLGQTLATKRQLAINYRAQSGIETIWQEDEEHYAGIDDANRDDMSAATVEKPTSTGSRAQRTDRDETKSNVFPNITQPYCDAAAARISDMLLPSDDRNWDIEPTPLPDMADFEAQMSAPIPPAPVAAATPPSAPGTPPGPPNPVAGAPTPPAPPPERQIKLPDGTTTTETALKTRIAEVRAEANRRSARAREQIDDWLTECDFLDEQRRAIDDCAKVGTGVLKGPAPARKSQTMFNQLQDGALELVISEKINPESRRISYWNLFPDPSCGDDIHRGNYIWEVDTLSEKKLKALRGLPGYIDSQIDLVIEEGPAKYTSAGKVPWDMKSTENKGQYQIWYFHGTVTKAEIEACGCQCDDGETFEALLTMVNDHVVHAALNPLESGEFPYDVLRWKRREGHWAGVGVSRQMRTPQKMVVAATRNMMDNAGVAGGPMFVVGRGIRPQNNIWELKPRKFWVRDGDDVENRPVRDDFEPIVIPMLQAELTAIIQLGMKMAEDCTGLPMLMQGQQGTAPDTVGGMQMLNNNATAVLRRIARLFDQVTTRHITRYYEWLMLYGDDDLAKGDMSIKARGSSALIERDAQTMELAAVVQLCLNPAFKKDPAKAMDEYLSSRRFDPSKFNYTEEELAKLQSQPPPEAPQVTAAKIRAEVDKERVARDTDRDTAYVRAETERSQREHEGRMAELAVKERLAILEYATQQKVSLDRVKADLAKTSMQLRTQKELAGADRQLRAAAQVAKPAVEPPGRAPDGESFQK